MLTTVSATVLYMTRKRNLLFLLCGLAVPNRCLVRSGLFSGAFSLSGASPSA